jgi:ubiquinone/menaquinone biosynthesis C-methylase UbiE
MKPKSQKQIWNDIAPEWNEFKKKPSVFVEEFLKKSKGKILDLGSGSGRHLMKLKNAKMYLVDFSENMIELAKKNEISQTLQLQFVVSPMSKLPFKNNFFNAAICISALHCVETATEREKVVEELHRVLKPRAQVFIAVWNKNSKRFRNAKKEKLIGWRGIGKRYYYLYDEDEIHKLFEKNKFRVIESQNSPLMIRFVAEKI